jgi:hypothetical protein
LVTLGGVIVASWAKFTGLLLAGGLVGGVLLWLQWRGRLQFQWIGLIAIAAFLAAAPYAGMFAQTPQYSRRPCRAKAETASGRTC